MAASLHWKMGAAETRQARRHPGRGGLSRGRGARNKRRSHTDRRTLYRRGSVQPRSGRSASACSGRRTSRPSLQQRFVSRHLSPAKVELPAKRPALLIYPSAGRQTVNRLFAMTTERMILVEQTRLAHRADPIAPARPRAPSATIATKAKIASQTSQPCLIAAPASTGRRPAGRRR